LGFLRRSVEKVRRSKKEEEEEGLEMELGVKRQT